MNEEQLTLDQLYAIALSEEVALIRCAECEPMCTCPIDCACKKGAK